MLCKDFSIFIKKLFFQVWSVSLFFKYSVKVLEHARTFRQNNVQLTKIFHLRKSFCTWNIFYLNRYKPSQSNQKNGKKDLRAILIESVYLFAFALGIIKSCSCFETWGWWRKSRNCKIVVFCRGHGHWWFGKVNSRTKR